MNKREGAAVVRFGHHTTASFNPGVLMRKGSHPIYRPVVFLDRAANFGFLTRSTAQTDKSIVWQDGKEYPLVTLDVSSASHPFYTGQQTTLDVAGRIERFNRRYRRGPGGTADEASDGREGG